jgi:hypothetical protein
MKRGLVRAAMALARAMRSLITAAPQSPLLSDRLRFVKEKAARPTAEAATTSRLHACHLNLTHGRRPTTEFDGRLVNPAGSKQLSCFRRIFTSPL